MTEKITVATCNTPQGHGDVIPHTPKERVNTLVDALNKEDAYVVSLQEFGPILRPGWSAHDNWAVVSGMNNNKPGQRQAMNAIAYRKDKLQIVNTHDFTFRIKGRKIHMLSIRFEIKATGDTFVFVAVHVPLARDAAASKRLAEVRRTYINARLFGYAKKIASKGEAVIVAGDRNDRNVGVWSHMKVGARRGVDWIVGSGVRFSNDREVKSVWKTVTDHRAMLVVDAEI